MFCDLSARQRPISLRHGVCISLLFLSLPAQFWSRQAFPATMKSTNWYLCVAVSSQVLLVSLVQFRSVASNPAQFTERSKKKKRRMAENTLVTVRILSRY